MFPRYLSLSDSELLERVETLWSFLEDCAVCPRNCHVNRMKGKKGFCGLADLPVVSSHHPHFGEEPVLVGTNGSGTIFFTSCNMACVYCQNFDISQLRVGKEVSFEKLAEMMLELQEAGCHNINLVTPTPQVAQIIKALSVARRKGLQVPLVYNTGSYDSVEILKILDGIVDIYMPDTKYMDEPLAAKYSLAPGYPEVMRKAIREMHRQVGDLAVDETGIAVHGLVVRHLVLPGKLAGSKAVFDFLANEISRNTYLNIMDQYNPQFKAFQCEELSRRISSREYQEAVELAKKAGLSRLC
jgi:putative pyruvate formate lyase activating enzyme